MKKNEAIEVEYLTCGVCGEDVVKGLVFPDPETKTCCIYCSGLYA